LITWTRPASRPCTAAPTRRLSTSSSRPSRSKGALPLPLHFAQGQGKL
jgi:hypothetical protein